MSGVSNYRNTLDKFHLYECEYRLLSMRMSLFSENIHETRIAQGRNVLAIKAYVNTLTCKQWYFIFLKHSYFKSEIITDSRLKVIGLLSEGSMQNTLSFGIIVYLQLSCDKLSYFNIERSGDCWCDILIWIKIYYMSHYVSCYV